MGRQSAPWQIGLPLHSVHHWSAEADGCTMPESHAMAAAGRWRALLRHHRGALARLCTGASSRTGMLHRAAAAITRRHKGPELASM